MKKIILFTSLSIILVLIGIFFYFRFVSNADGNGEEGISQISFDGIKIGDAIQEKMKNLVMDASYLYMYNEIGINVDENDIINYLNFYTIIDEVTVEDANIKYKNDKLSTLDDFEKHFGKGERKDYDNDNNDENYIIEYKDGSYILELDIVDGELYNVCLEKEN